MVKIPLRIEPPVWKYWRETRGSMFQLISDALCRDKSNVKQEKSVGRVDSRSLSLSLPHTRVFFHVNHRSKGHGPSITTVRISAASFDGFAISIRLESEYQSREPCFPLIVSMERIYICFHKARCVIPLIGLMDSLFPR